MPSEPLRDLHDARLGTATDIDAFREYHYRRRHLHSNNATEVNGISDGYVIIHIGSSEQISPIQDPKFDPAELAETREKWTVIKRGKEQSVRPSFDANGLIAIYEDHHSNRNAITRVHRSQMLEAVSTDIIDKRRGNGELIFAAGKFEQALVNLAKEYVERFCAGNREGVFIASPYINFEDVRVYPHKHHRPIIIGEEVIESPVISLGPEEIRRELSPVIRPFWNAVNRTQSRYKTDNGWEYNNRENQLPLERPTRPERLWPKPQSFLAPSKTGDTKRTLRDSQDRRATVSIHRRRTRVSLVRVGAGQTARRLRTGAAFHHLEGQRSPTRGAMFRWRGRSHSSRVAAAASGLT